MDFKVIACTLMITFSISELSAQLVGDTYAKSKRTKKATFYYVYDGTPGFVEEGSNGEKSGLLVDIMKEFENYVEEIEGIQVTSIYKQAPNADFDVFMSEVKNGKGGVFGLSNVSIREDRKRDYLFSPSYMNNVTVLITNAKSPTLLNLDDIKTRFAGKKAYAVGGSSYYNRLQEIKEKYYPSLEIISLSSVNDFMNEIINNDHAFGVVDLNYYLESLKNKASIKRHPAGDKGGDKFGIIMPLSNDWEPVIRKFFDSGFIGGTEYRRIITENLGKGALRLMEQANQN